MIEVKVTMRTADDLRHMSQFFSLTADKIERDLKLTAEQTADIVLRANKEQLDKAQAEFDAGKVHDVVGASDVPVVNVEPPKPRGRPRKNAQSAEPSPIAQAAVASNTASVQADPMPPAAEGALTSAEPVTAPVVAGSGNTVQAALPSLTHDIVKAKLQDVMHAAKDQNAGMAAAYDIVKKYGYTHVRDIKPEHFAAIFADAEAKLPKEPRL